MNVQHNCTYILYITSMFPLEKKVNIPSFFYKVFLYWKKIIPGTEELPVLICVIVILSD